MPFFLKTSPSIYIYADDLRVCLESRQLLSLFASFCSSRLPLAPAFLFAWSSLRFCSAVGDDFIVNMCKHSFTESRVSHAETALCRLCFFRFASEILCFTHARFPQIYSGWKRLLAADELLFLEGPWDGKETVEPDKHTNVAMCKSITWKQERDKVCTTSLGHWCHRLMTCAGSKIRWDAILLCFHG